MSSINNILVIGNGFDLACNYDTRYIDFINFIKLVNNKENEIIISNEHIESFIKRYKRASSKIESNPNYVKLKEIIKDNTFITHFTALNYDLNIWSDVEEEIHKIIIAINNIFNDDNLDGNYIKKAYASKVLCLDYDDEYVKKVMNEFKLIESRYISFNSSNLHPLNAKYYDYVYKIKWKPLCDYLNTQLENFKQALIIYLREFAPIIKSMYFDTATDRQLRDNIKPDQIITFNYTDYYDKYYDCNAIHIHGSLKERNIVLGFEDDKNISLKYCRFFKYFQRIQYKLQIIKRSDKMFNIALEHNGQNGIYAIGAKKSNVIHFYGVSFDITDEDYIRELYGRENDKVVVYYYDDDDYNTKILNLIKIFSKEMITNDIHNNKLVMQPIMKSEWF